MNPALKHNPVPRHRTVSKRYSTAFKRKVVEQIESGTYTIAECQRLYAIGGSMTIYNWLRRFGKAHLIANHVVIQMKDERERIKQLEANVQALESALAQAHLENLVLKSTLEVAEEHYGEDVKKNFAPKASNAAAKPWTKTKR